MIKYRIRLINIENSRISKKVILYDKSLCKENGSNELKCLCYNVNMNNCFENNLEINVDNFRDKTCKNYENKWKSGVIDKPKLGTYIKFKNTFKVEDYVKHCNCRRKCSPHYLNNLT